LIVHHASLESSMKKYLLLFVSFSCFAQPAVEYEVSFPNAEHHEAEIHVTWREVTAPLKIRMSRSSPGRYSTHEFGKNVYDLQATDAQGLPLPVSREEADVWVISGHDGTVSVQYRLYGDRIDGTHAAIDPTHARLNMPASFVWAPDYQDRPVSIRFTPPNADWKIATQLLPSDDARVFTAPDLQYFMDSPVELSDFTERSWRVQEADRTQTFRLLVHHDGLESDVDTLMGKVQNVVEAQRQVFGELPAFDNGEYLFIADYLPHAVGDGMEHRNSTMLSRAQSLIEADYQPQLGTISHELFHAWNAERIRPRELEPFDFSRANMTSSLWFVEGFTSYYGPLTVLRAGEMTLEDYLAQLGNTLSEVIHSPARRFGSPTDMSEQAPFFDGGISNDPTNRRNIFLSYYTYGAALGAVLDLMLRKDFADLSLDAYMRQMWQDHGRGEVPYSPSDLQAALARVTGDEAFAERFFSNSIRRSELPDMDALLAPAGLRLVWADPDTAYAGDVALAWVNGRLRLENNPLIGSPIYEAGLEKGDEILAIDRFPIRSMESWEQTLRRFSPGEQVSVLFLQRGNEKQANMTLQTSPRMRLRKVEDIGETLTAEQAAFRESWLGVK
jgi:predicted metalloprotease with PDZ domain